MDDIWAWQNINADAIVARGPALFGGIIVRTTAGSAGTVVVFEGENANGRLYAGYVCPINLTSPHLEIYPALFRRGIFLDLDSGISSVLVRYKPMREEQLIALPEYLVEGAPE